ncbi:hypothetical protein F4780DRAFT_781733 [Xylariomycetidae sp. FL0641]|nr:hypothetical protein F4780DRAFT_781733 [Xylariomycetidae sp. FL0641]
MAAPTLSLQIPSATSASRPSALQHRLSTLLTRLTTTSSSSSSSSSRSSPTHDDATSNYGDDDDTPPEQDDDDHTPEQLSSPGAYAEFAALNPYRGAEAGEGEGEREGGGVLASLRRQLDAHCRDVRDEQRRALRQALAAGA